MQGEFARAAHGPLALQGAVLLLTVGPLLAADLAPRKTSNACTGHLGRITLHLFFSIAICYEDNN